jgi:hypothetical protein
MESAKDSIKYIRPVYTNTQYGKSMKDRTFGVPGLDTAVNPNDPWNINGSAQLQDPDYRRAMYETTEDRYVTELANALIYTASAGDQANVGGVMTALTASQTYVIFGQVGTNGSAEFASLGYLDGYGVLFGTGGEANPLAVQAKVGANLSTAGEWLVKAGSTLQITAVANGVFELTDTVGGTDVAAVTKGYGRFNSEGDFAGDFLGEVELIMTDYWFRPRPTAIGVTWSQLTELVLDTSFGVSAEELLVDYAGQEIKKALDFRAVKVAYQAARMNPASYTIHFNAAAGYTATTDDSYLHTAQTFSQAIERVGDVMFNDINRGGVSRLVGGPAACSYLRLNSGFSTKGAQARVGGHQVGEIYGIPVFKVPSSVIPDNQLVAVWKNDENEADVSIAFGTLVPFFSTGINNIVPEHCEVLSKAA